MFKWPVVPICEKQKLDIKPEDLLENGLYRKCNVYSGGGGYDKFNSIFYKRFGWIPNPTQFVVQLYGCELSCPYCYVTVDGVWGEPKYISTNKLIESYLKSGLCTFHLMGGSPALYLDRWRELAKDPRIVVFHSDLLCIESWYNIEWLRGLPGLYVVSVKEKTLQYVDLFLTNLKTVVESGIHFYITFTGKPYLRDIIEKEFGSSILQDSFTIEINWDYRALIV